jgi:hypothetical protein
MKKRYTLLICLFLGSISYAQIIAEKAYLPIAKPDYATRMVGLSSDDRAPGDDIVTDDFSDPSQWNYPADANGNAWEIVTSAPADIVTYIGDMESTTAFNGFALFNGIQYLLDGTVTPQDVVLEYIPVINCEAATAVTLAFEQRYRAFNTDKTFIEVSNDGGSSYPYIYEINADMPTNDPARQERFMQDITLAAAGQNDVKIRFRWTELLGDPSYGSGYGWMLDDFRVFEAWDYDQNLTATYHRSGVGTYMANGMEYYKIPLSQRTDIDFAGTSHNLGGVVQTDAKLNVEVTGAGTYSGTSAMSDILVGDTDSLFCTTSFLPVEEGIYNVMYFVDGENEEQETSNDTIYDSFEVTEFIYSRDNGLGGSSIGNVTTNLGNPLLIGNVMDIFGDAEIHAIELEITNDDGNIGKLIFGQLMLFSAGEFIYFGQTEDHIVSAEDNGTAIRLEFDEPIEIEANSTLLVLAGHYGDAPEVRFRMAQGVDEQSVLGYTSGASSPFYLTTPSAIMVRLDMGESGVIDDSGIEELTNDFTIQQNMPNPFSATTAINYELNKQANVKIEVVDIAGKVVQTVEKGNQSVGKHQFVIDGQALKNGVYFYTFTVNGQRITKRMLLAR